MTTPADWTVLTARELLAINDRDSLKLVSRLVDAQVTLLEAQLAQQKSLQTAITRERQVPQGLTSFATQELEPVEDDASATGCALV